MNSAVIFYKTKQNNNKKQTKTLFANICLSYIPKNLK